jgi:hypothetical protein
MAGISRTRERSRRGPIAVASLGLLLGACGWSYRAGHLLEAKPGAESRAAGCMDWRISLHEGDALVPANWTVLRIEAGNRCEEPLLVDLSRARVFEVREGDERTQVRLYDPAGEVRRLALDGRQLTELLAYEPPARATEAPLICVDLSAVAVAPHAPRDEPCLRARGEHLVQDTSVNETTDLRARTERSVQDQRVNDMVNLLSSWREGAR